MVVRTSDAHARPWWLRSRFVAPLAIAVAVLLVWQIAAWESRTSTLQAHYFAGKTKRLAYTVEPGPSAAIRFPQSGPSDERLGYTRLPETIDRLLGLDYGVTAQARQSEALLDYTAHGYHAPFREKAQAGLSLLDCRGDAFYGARYPERVYADFDSVPRLIVDALAYIENRELLGVPEPMHNPALEPMRLGKALLDHARGSIDQGHHVSGGSTLATQLEKVRHSPDGRTRSAREKWRQIVSASQRAYIDGEQTLIARRRIIVDYLNNLPLGAHPSKGEVHGIGDGLRDWYGADLDLASQALRKPQPEGQALAEQARFFRQVLGLFIAQRRPAYYFGAGERRLHTRVDSYLRVLASAGVITPALRDAALPLRPAVVRDSAPPPVADYTARKASNLVRVELASLLETPRLYDLDRLDLAAASSIDAALQEAVTEQLRRLRVPGHAKAVGLVGPRMLEGGDASRLVFSFTLYEKSESGHRLRVQADTLDQPFDINAGAKLELGSTAKLRTLVTYLEIVAALHARYATLDAGELRRQPIDRRDRLSLWAVDYLGKAADKSLAAMLDAAMERRYSADPYESFYTGGGVHRFRNFDRKHDRMQPSVREALQESVNLAFIRLMRDVVAYHAAHGAASPARILEGAEPVPRAELLARIADREGSTFVRKFYRKYHGKTADEALGMLVSRGKPRRERLAAIHRTVLPDADGAAFGEFMHAHLPAAAVAGARKTKAERGMSPLAALYERHGRYSLVDRGYLARVHPLELWVAAYLRAHPEASLAEVVGASRAERQQVYAWLFRERARAAQELRIAALREADAFTEIQRAWQRLGYPFDTLVPSYATAIGSSGDRPAALAELMGIIASGGMRQATVRIEELHFAAQTPYETLLRRHAGQAERVLAPEVAATAQRALLQVVEKGTARRLRGAFDATLAGPLAIGGKTGTGDNRSEVRAARGKRIESRVLNRTATFVFFIGDWHFGTVTAYVPGPAAARYRFTSALPVQILKSLAPTLATSIAAAAGNESSCSRPRADPAPSIQAVQGAGGANRVSPRARSSGDTTIRMRSQGGLLPTR